MSIPQIGNLVWDADSVACQVVSIGTKRSTGQTMLKVLCPHGARIIPLEAVKGISSAGARVMLKGTDLTYTLLETYQQYMGLSDGERTYEQWARLQTHDGKPAYWKLSQLEAIQ
jgi:hypothetical protein